MPTTRSRRKKIVKKTVVPPQPAPPSPEPPKRKPRKTKSPLKPKPKSKPKPKAPRSKTKTKVPRTWSATDLERLLECGSEHFRNDPTAKGLIQWDDCKPDTPFDLPWSINRCIVAYSAALQLEAKSKVLVAKETGTTPESTLQSIIPWYDLYSPFLFASTPVEIPQKYRNCDPTLPEYTNLRKTICDVVQTVGGLSNCTPDFQVLKSRAFSALACGAIATSEANLPRWIEYIASASLRLISLTNSQYSPGFIGSAISAGLKSLSRINANAGIDSIELEVPHTPSFEWIRNYFLVRLTSSRLVPIKVSAEHVLPCEQLLPWTQLIDELSEEFRQGLDITSEETLSEDPMEHESLEVESGTESLTQPSTPTQQQSQQELELEPEHEHGQQQEQQQDDSNHMQDSEISSAQFEGLEHTASDNHLIVSSWLGRDITSDDIPVGILNSPLISVMCATYFYLPQTGSKFTQVTEEQLLNRVVSEYCNMELPKSRVTLSVLESRDIPLLRQFCSLYLRKTTKSTHLSVVLRSELDALDPSSELGLLKTFSPDDLFEYLRQLLNKPANLRIPKSRQTAFESNLAMILNVYSAFDKPECS